MRFIINAMLGLATTAALASAVSVDKAQHRHLKARHVHNAAEAVQFEARDLHADKFQPPSNSKRAVNTEAVHQLKARVVSVAALSRRAGFPGFSKPRDPPRPPSYLFKKPKDQYGNVRPMTPEELVRHKRMKKHAIVTGVVGGAALTGIGVSLGYGIKKEIKEGKARREQAEQEAAQQAQQQPQPAVDPQADSQAGPQPDPQPQPKKRAVATQAAHQLKARNTKWTRLSGYSKRTTLGMTTGAAPAA